MAAVVTELRSPILDYRVFLLVLSAKFILLFLFFFFFFFLFFFLFLFIIFVRPKAKFFVFAHLLVTPYF
jgi:hypothetical protein